MKPYKPLLSSAPAHSILNARSFRYRDSASTDIRATFAKFRRQASKPDIGSDVATDIRAAPSNPATLHVVCSRRAPG